MAEERKRMVSTAAAGYPQDLFVLPFDHRGTLEVGLFGIRDREPTPAEVEQLSQYKRIIYEGFLRAIEKGVPQERAAILVDQKYGAAILRDAAQRHVLTCVPVEKSGMEEFDFEYGDEFAAHLAEAAPTFAKALVRYNPERDRQLNERQRERLRLLCQHAQEVGYKFMLELLVPPTDSQLQQVRQDRPAYDLTLRPGLTARAMAEFQGAGVDPDVWKLEGTEEPQAARDLVAQARADGREKVGVIVLGRGEDAERVSHWLTVGAQTQGVIGFAVGRTVFWEPLVAYKEARLTRDEAVARIAEVYLGFYKLFTGVRAKAAAATSGGSATA
jgi:5-dehydro-2-deoxygluconokinase